jgi:hypothetical protein
MLIKMFKNVYKSLHSWRSCAKVGHEGLVTISMVIIVRSLALLPRVEGPEASTETRPHDYDCMPNSPVCFSACKTPQELPVTQLVRHADLFLLVIADNQRPETLSLPHGLVPPIKPTTHFSQAAAP